MNRKIIQSLDTVLALSVFCLFAVCSLFLILIGSNVYRGIVNSMDSNSEIRTSLSYVSNKVRSADRNEVSLQSANGLQILVIANQYGGEKYNTYIYQYDGCLMELFSKADKAFTPGGGDKITPVAAFTITKKGNMLYLSATGRNRRMLSQCLSLP